MAAPTVQSAPPDIACRLERLATGVTAPVRLRLTLTNRSAHAVRVLTWGTPFEGWMQPFVRVHRDGVEVPYRGPMVKRGDPDDDEYLRLARGRSKSVAFTLAPAFDVSAPGVYRIEPQVVMQDVVAASGEPVARTREQLRPVPLDCPAIEFRQR